MLASAPEHASFVYRVLCVGGLLAVLLVTLNKRLDLWQRLVGAGVLQTFILAWAESHCLDKSNNNR